MEASYYQVYGLMGLPRYNHVPNYFNLQALIEGDFIGYASVEVRAGKRSVEISNFASVPKD